MNTTAFLSLEDIADNLPRYDESVVSVEMDTDLAKAYEELEEDIRSAMRQHRGNKSLMSILLNTLLLYPDHPYGFDAIWARAFDPQTREYVRFLAATPVNLSEDRLFAKERALIADVSEELRQGRRCQIYATYTGEKDVTLRLETILRQAGFRVVVLRSSVPTEKREDWYERQLQAGVEVVVCHPKLVETGLDLLAFPTLYFYETGYSLHTLPLKSPLLFGKRDGAEWNLQRPCLARGTVENSGAQIDVAGGRVDLEVKGHTLGAGPCPLLRLDQYADVATLPV
jgi:hypothetical protein